MRDLRSNKRDLRDQRSERQKIWEILRNQRFERNLRNQISDKPYILGQIDFCNGQTDRQTDRQTDICDSRVAFATEKKFKSATKLF